MRRSLSHGLVTSMLLLLMWTVTGCMSIEAERERFIGQDARFLLKEKGSPTRKESDDLGERWVYERVVTSVEPERVTQKVVQVDAQGQPTEMETTRHPATETQTLHYQFFFLDDSGRIYDLSRGSRPL